MGPGTVIAGPNEVKMRFFMSLGKSSAKFSLFLLCFLFLRRKLSMPHPSTGGAFGQNIVENTNPLCYHMISIYTFPHITKHRLPSMMSLSSFDFCFYENSLNSGSGYAIEFFT